MVKLPELPPWRVEYLYRIGTFEQISKERGKHFLLKRGGQYDFSNMLESQPPQIMGVYQHEWIEGESHSQRAERKRLEDIFCKQFKMSLEVQGQPDILPPDLIAIGYMENYFPYRVIKKALEEGDMERITFFTVDNVPNFYEKGPKIISRLRRKTFEPFSDDPDEVINDIDNILKMIESRTSGAVYHECQEIIKRYRHLGFNLDEWFFLNPLFSS